MLVQLTESSWAVERTKVPEAAPLAQVRKGMLGLYPHPALFETKRGFQDIDGSKTMFMLDKLLEIKLVDNIWYIDGKGPFEQYVAACYALVNDANQPLCERLRQVTKLLSLPEEYPIMLTLGYSAARFFEHLPQMTAEQGEPEVLMRVYRYLVHYDHGDDAEKGAQIDVLKTQHDEVVNTQRLVDALTQPEQSSAPMKPWQLGSIKDLTEKDAFYAAVERAKEHIRIGDIYQVQLCRRAISNAAIPPVDLYERLVSINPAPYMYYLDLGDRHVISSSPELMLRVSGGMAQVRPIAGTMTHEEYGGSPLEKIPKEAAEHLMLVDLARNDLARCAVTGGVKVSSFMQEDAYGPLLHLVSTIDTPVRRECDIWDLIATNFPAGTMTGAPKIRAMEIISDLEQAARGLYTGCAGYISGTNSAVLALTIRTIIGDSGLYLLQSAAGVVADSQASSEWEEAGAKINSFSRAMG